MWDWGLLIILTYLAWLGGKDRGRACGVVTFELKEKECVWKDGPRISQGSQWKGLRARPESFRVKPVQRS